MKKFSLKNAIAAMIFIIGMAGAFAFNSPTEELVWFELDQAGNVENQMAGSPNCPSSGRYCAVAFATEDVQNAGGAPITSLNDSDANQYVKSIQERTP